MDKINFIPDTGYDWFNLLYTCNVNTNIKCHLPGSVCGEYK